jgi:Na+/proline symporter
MNTSVVHFAPLDWAVVGAYFVVLAGIALWVAFKREQTAADYFLASRNAGWFLIGTSIFASNIGAEHLVGLAGSGAGSGMAFAHWELHSYLCVLLGWLFAPYYLRSSVFTTPEFLEQRYTPAIAAVFMLGILSKQVSPQSGLVGLVAGFALGMTRLVLQTLHETTGASFADPVQAFVDVNWLYFAFLLFVFTCLVVLAVSLVTPPAAPGRMAGLTRDTITPEQRAEVRASYDAWDIAHSAAILAVIASVYLYFW